MAHLNRPNPHPPSGWEGESHVETRFQAEFGNRCGRRARCGAIVACLVFWLGIGWVADGKTQDPASQEPVQTTTGMVGRLKEVKLPGSELEVIPLEDRDTPIVARIVRTFPHGSDFRYEIEFYGLVPGDYDLRAYLRRVDGSSMESVPSIPVRVAPVLPEGEVRPNQLIAKSPPRLGGYQSTLIVIGVAWAIGLLTLIFWRRGGHNDTQGVTQRPVTMAERLRPLIDNAVAGDATHAELASLERSLLTYWRKRLDLQSESTAAAIHELRAHPEAGGLMTQLEAWLHRPDAEPTLDIEALLAPYRDVPEGELELQDAATSASRL